MEKIVLKYRGGGNFARIKPKFSACEESIFISRQNKVLQFATKTGLLVSEFHTESPIVGFNVYSEDSYENLLVCCENGELIVWKTVTKFKMFSKKFSPIENVTSFFHIPNETQNEGIISYKCNREHFVGIMDISKGKIKKLDTKIHKFVSISVSWLRFVAIMGKRTITLVDFDETRRKIIQINKKFEEFTYVTCHPNEETILTGDSEGQMTLYQNIFKKNVATAKFHWHTLAINCLQFSNEGSYFYSGGNECVFVRWDYNGAKKFIPRLPGFIHEISASPKQLVAILTSDNTVKIVDSGLNEMSSIQNLVISSDYSGGIKLDPRTKSLVLNGTTGALQFYNPNSNQLVYTVDVVGQNKLSNERNCNIENTNVTKFDVSKSGLWLVTVEERPDSSAVHKEIRMKFWNFDENSQKFNLNTSIEKPHETSVSNVLFQYINDEEMSCITVGGDAKFKIWRKIKIFQVNVERIVWNCFSVGFYRNLSCRGLSCSHDGSLISVGFGAILTCWAVENNELKCSLKYPKFNEEIRHCEFGTNNLCHLIVTSSENRLSVWNILTLTMIWTVPLKTEFLLSNKLSVYMTVISENGEIFVFSPNNPNPIYTNKEIIKSGIITAGLIPIQLVQDDQKKWYRRVEIYFLDSNRELYSIGVEDDEFIDESREELRSVYQQILSDKRTKDVSVEKREHLFTDNSKSLKNYLLGPSHTTIPIRLTCKSLVRSFLVHKNTTKS